MTTTQDSVAQGMSQADLDRFKPLNGFILVRRESLPKQHGAIHLVEKSDDDTRKTKTWARVIRTGGLERCYVASTRQERHAKPPKMTDRYRPLQVKVGDRVLIDRYAGHDIEVIETHERYVLIGEDEIDLIDIGGDAGAVRKSASPADITFIEDQVKVSKVDSR